MAVDTDRDEGDRDPSTRDDKDDTPKTLTEEEHNRRMRGLAKKHEAAESELAKLRADQDARDAAGKEAERKKLEEQGEYKRLLEQTDATAKTHQERADKAEAALKTLHDEIGASNEERIKALPKDEQDLVADLAKELAPVALSKYLAKVEAKLAGSERVRDVDGAGGRRVTKGKDDKKGKRGEAFVFGGDK